MIPERFYGLKIGDVQNTEEQVLKNVSKIKEFAKSSHKEEVRAMVQQYVDRVTVFHDRVEVVFKGCVSF